MFISKNILLDVVNLNKVIKNPVTELNEYDRKILSKYTRFHTNMIESNTAKTDRLEDERYRPER